MVNSAYKEVQKLPYVKKIIVICDIKFGYIAGLEKSE
jgi:hypothetical protein